MGNGHRPAPFNLAPEKGNHRPGGPHHISKPHRHQPGPVSLVGLQHHLRHPLAGAHHIGGPHRLVRAYQHHPLRFMLDGLFNDRLAPHNIVEHALPGVPLQHGHMLVGRRMKHHMGFKGPEHRIGQPVVLHIPQHGPVFQVPHPMFQFHLDGIEQWLRRIKEYQGFRGKPNDLPAQFGTDGTAGPRHQNHLIGQVTPDGLHIQLHLRPTQQIMIIHVTQGLYAYLSIDKLSYSRQCLAWNRTHITGLHNLAYLFTGCRGDRNDHLLHV